MVENTLFKDRVEIDINGMQAELRAAQSLFKQDRKRGLAKLNKLFRSGSVSESPLNDVIQESGYYIPFITVLARSSNSSRSRAFLVSAAARWNSSAASLKRPSFASRSARTLGRR